jgi:non-homologous end joining protein Ku
VERKGKPAINDAVDRAFALICSAMAEEKQVALIKLAMRGPARYGLLTPAGQMWTLMFEEQVRSDRELPTTQPAAAEIALARQLVSMNRLDAAPELTDDAGARVLEYATAKALGTAPMPAPVAAHEMADDLLAALTASIAAKQAPAAKAKRAKKVAA